MKFEITVDAIDATLDGTLGFPPDTHRVYVQGLKHYFVDDIEVSLEEFEAAVAAEGVAWLHKAQKAP